MSFFDEEDDPQGPPEAEARRPRGAVRPPRMRSGRPPGGSGRPPFSQNQQQVQTRRAVAVGVIVVVVIVMALLIHGCEASQSTDSLKNYAAGVEQLMSASQANGANLFADLQSNELGSASNEQTLQKQIDTVLQTARKQVSQAEALNAPGQLASAQSTLVQVMKLREMGIGVIASNIQPAASTNTSTDAVKAIAQGMYMLAGSDVSYKTFVAQQLDQALTSAGIIVGGTSGVQIFGGQILNDLGWLNTRFIGEKTGAALPTTVVNQAVAGDTQGHVLNYVSVGGTELSASTTNTVAASPAPTFTLNFTNGGQTPEYKVECLVKVIGLSDAGTSIIPETQPGHTYSCNVTLPEQPPAGATSIYKVEAEIHPVPGETTTSNNYLTYTVDFN